ncbi:MAG TPA: MFS transporter [Caulobacteraceae bacterium]|jgi:MFS family permease
MESAARPTDVFRLPGYLAFWTASTVSGFGSYITGLALQVLVVVTLKGTATDVGLLNAARWLPYLLFGLVVGAMVDRYRRMPILVASDIARAVLLVAIPALWLLGWLSLPVLMAFVGAFGLLTLLNDAANQSFVPRLVPGPALLAANARLDQGGTVAQTSGPLVAGALVTLLGAPLAVLIDAASYLVSAAMLAIGVRVAEPKPAAGRRRLDLGREIGEGLRWVYRHPTLAPLALSTHGWFFFNSMLGTVFAPFVLVGLRLSPFALGVALAAAGAGGFTGSLVAARLGLRWGAGWAVIGCHALMPLACATIALAPATGGQALAVAMLALGQGVYGFAMGAENANSLGYRQSVTPDALQSRMNTTMRSLNRAMIVAGAPIGGLIADRIGYRPALWIAAGGLLLVPAVLAATPFRRARHGDLPIGTAR